MKKQTKSNQLPYHSVRQQKFLKLWIPRTEMLILLIGLVCTVCGKLIVVQRHHPPNLFGQLAHIMFPDIFFVVVIVLMINCLYLLKPSTFIVRSVLLMVGLMFGWSILNLAWLVKSGVQLQPGILIIFIRDFTDLWPLVQTHLSVNLKQVLLMVVLFCGFSVYFLWSFIRPMKVITARIHHIRRATLVALAIVILLLIKFVARADTEFSLARETLGFSSHWHALVSTITNIYKEPFSGVQTRYIPQKGQRKVVPPKCPLTNLPNIVLVLLESVPYSETSLANPNLGTTPYLARLSRHGVEFQLTRVPIVHTTKAIWVILTSTTPVIRSDYIEAIPMKQSYEGLPTLLARIGYRSAFFKMAKGRFECAPSLCNNLGFDWAWFRENLEDPSTYLGYLAGDDCRMIEPAFEWVLRTSQPFFLMMLTSVTHDPYELPGEPILPNEEPYRKYLRTLQYTDYFLEQVCQKLKENGLEKDTILCVLGDHGTSFRIEAGQHGRWIPSEEVIRVPWVIRWPGHLNAGDTIEWPCSQMDVTPTILKLIGFDISDAGFEGKDALVASENHRRLYFSSWYDNSPLGYIEGNKKLVYWPYIDKIFEYNLDADPNELSPKMVSLKEAEQIKRDIREWQKSSQIRIDGKRYTEIFLFSHWQIFSVGQSAWGYYVP